MIQFLLLAIWASTGAAVAAVMTPEPRSPLAWMPMAIFLGPLWAAVAIDRRPRGRVVGSVAVDPVPARDQRSPETAPTVNPGPDRARWGVVRA